jgi:hypothetical protein
MSGVSATAWIVTAVLLPYVVAVNLIVGGLIIGVYARWRATPEHLLERAALRRALPATLYAVAAAGVSALAVIRSAYPAAVIKGAVTLSGASLVPGLIHLVLGACAVAGLAVALAARHAAPSPGAARWLERSGASWTVLCTAANLLVGVVLMLRLPHASAIRFTGADLEMMLVFALAVLSALLALGFVAMSLALPWPRAYLWAGTVMLLVTLLAMLRMREDVRGAAVALTPSTATVGFAVLLDLVAIAALSRAWRAFGTPR